MTIVHRPVPTSSPLRRAWAAPVAAHLTGLALVLLALLPVVGTSGAFMPDEGAAVIQARSLATGQGWIVEHPVPEADPGGRYYPLALGQEGLLGTAPLGKHPLYPVLLAGAFRVGGVPAMVLLSVLGTVAAAGFAAALARRLDRGLARPAVWVVGVASPLAFDGYLLVAHTLGAAAVASAVLAATVAVERRSWRPTAAVAVGVVVAVLLRNEALLLGGALAVTAATVGAVRRDAAAAVVATVAAVAAGAAHLGERVWVGAIVGSDVAVPTAPFRHGGEGLVAGRLRGVAVTWLTPAQAGSAVVVVALLVMAGSVALAANRARVRPDDGPRIVGPTVVAAAAALLAAAVDPANVVPGLLVAFPMVAVGLVLVDRGVLATAPALLLAGTAGVFAVAVMATQYSTGGTGEWGGRYFAIGIPVAVPVLLLAVLRAGRRLDPGTATRALAALAVCSLAMTTMAVVSHRHRVRASSALAASVVRAGAAVGDARPIIVTTDVILPRLAWPAFDEVRWLLATPDDVDDVAGKLRAAGVDRFGLVTATPDRERGRLRGWDVVSTEDLEGAPLTMLVADVRA